MQYASVVLTFESRRLAASSVGLHLCVWDFIYVRVVFSANSNQLDVPVFVFFPLLDFIIEKEFLLQSF